MAEVLFTYKTDDGFAVERLKADKSGAHFKITAVPAYISHIGYGDIVKVEEDQGELHFDELVETSGHSTIHIVVMGHDHVTDLTDGLKGLDLGMSFLHDGRYIVVDVPPETDYEMVKPLLEDAFRSGLIDYKEACLSRQHGGR